MYWADKIADQIVKSGKFTPYWVDDMKTPSGFAHVGSLVGPVVHSIVYRALKKRGVNVNFTFVINDFDTVDGLSQDLLSTHSKYFGFPLKMTPSPDPAFESMADYYSNDFINSFRSLGVEATILSSWDMYRAGKFDDVIKKALDNGEKIQEIYKKISGSDKKQKGWLPLQVICEKCGKLGTTRVHSWDGEKVSYVCEPNLVKWAQGCGHEGQISPLSGNGKLPWKVDWPAHWKVIGVTVEGAGKDHASKGGSYDIAMSLCEEVFDYPKPYRMPYEFLLIGGKKMSSSKGLGLKAHDLVNILPSTIGRFLFAKHNIGKQANFDPMASMAIPELFDLYDQVANAYWDKSDEKLAATFEYSQISEKIPAKHFLPRFIDLVNYLQDTKVDIYQKFEEKKGDKLNEIEKDVLEERIKYAKVWISDYAPKTEVFTPTRDIPEEAKNLTEKQLEYLKKVLDILYPDLNPEEFQTVLYNLSKEIGIPAKDAFAAIYISLIGKTHGPKAAWFLLEHIDVAKNRFLYLTNLDLRHEFLNDNSISQINDTDFATERINKDIKEKFSGISFAWVIINNVTIRDSSKELEIYKNEVISQVKAKFNLKDIRELPSIKSYRAMLKSTGTDANSHLPSPEALLRRIIQGKDLYRVNTAVDAYNLAVLETNIGLGGFDLQHIKFPISLRFAKDGEELRLLGDNGKVAKTRNGQLVYVDSEKVLTLDLNYRDIEESKITLDSKDILLIADGGIGIPSDAVFDALKKGAVYIQKYCGGVIGEYKLVK